MTDKPSYRRLPEDDCIGEEMMYRYIDGKLNSTEMHQVELHTLECGLCADALEGLSNVKERDRKGGYWELPGGTGAAEGGKVISLFAKPSFYYSAAACVLLLVGFFTMRNFISNGDNAAPKVAATDKADRFDPEKQNATYRADSIALPDNTRISVNDLEEDLKSDSMLGNDRSDLRAVNKSKIAGPNDIPKTPASANGNTITLDQPNNSTPDFDGFVLQRDNTVTDQMQHTDLNSEMTLNTVTLADEIDLKKNQYKNDKDSNRAVTLAPQAATNGGGVASSKASDDAAANSQSTGSVSNEVVYTNNSTVTSTSQATNSENVTSGDSQVSVSDTTTYFHSTQQTMHPNQETDADVDRSYDAGVRMLTAGDPQGSLIFFDDVIAHPANAHYQDAEWKKAEAFILLSKKDDAKTLLNKIVSEGGKYKTQAQDKLKTL